MHVREALAFVQDVVRLTKADTMPSLQLQELRKLVVTGTHHARQVYRLADTRFSASSEEADVDTLQSIVFLVMFWLTVRESSAAAHEKRPLAHTSIRLVVLHKSVFISLQFPDSLQKRSPGCS